MSFLEEIGARLEAQGVGAVGTSIFLRQMPDEGDELVAVIPTGGLESLETMGNIDHVMRPSLQVLARAKKTKTAHDKLLAVRAALQGFKGNLSGGGGSARYLRILALQPEPVPIGQDDSKRWRWSLNFQVHKEPSA